METFQILSASNPAMADASDGVTYGSNQDATCQLSEFRVGHLVQPLDLAETHLASL